MLYLPAYSPDLNPIEQVFAKLKALLRKAAARTRDELWDVIGSLLDAFTPAECRNYLENAGAVQHFAPQQAGRHRVALLQHHRDARFAGFVRKPAARRRSCPSSGICSWRTAAA